jgi:site-specific recombinase XerC
MTDISGKRYNLDNFEASFREFLQNEGVSALTLKNYLSDHRHFWGWYTFYLHSRHNDNLNCNFESIFSLVSMIDFEAVSCYKDYLETNALPVKTINRRLSTLRKFCSFCINQNWMRENPAKRVVNAGVRIVDERLDEPRVVQKDFLREFNQCLASERADSHNADLILEDVNEFLSICHPS